MTIFVSSVGGHTGMSDGYGDFIINSSHYTPLKLEAVRDSIHKGASPVGAAAKAGIPKRVFREWRNKSEEFADKVHMWQDEYYASMMERTNSDIEEITNPKKRANTTMKFLKNTDPSFGVKKVDVTERVEEGLKNPPGSETDEISKDLIKEAEKAANNG